MKNIELSADASHNDIVRVIQDVFANIVPQIKTHGFRLLEVRKYNTNGKGSTLRPLVNGDDVSITMDSLLK